MHMQIKHFRPPMLAFGLLILAVALAIMIGQTFRREVPSVEPAVQTVDGAKLALTSTAFESEQPIPAVYTCNGANINPPLSIENPPGNAKEFVIIVHDPDAGDGNWVHWTVWNIPLDTTSIAEHSFPPEVTQGTTSFGTAGYGGPCPPNGSGMHRYIFELYALNDTLNLSSTTSRDELVAAMNGKVLARTQLVGTVESK